MTPTRKELIAYRLSLNTQQKKPIIAIDGPAGSGKSSTARAFAKFLKLPFIDTGAMYRALTLNVIRHNLSFGDISSMVRLAKNTTIELRGKDPLKQKVFLDGKEVTKAIREPELTKQVFHVAQEPKLRKIMVKLQKRIGSLSGGVMEGRDIGTKVFPKADFKFYFEANDDIRALRRYRELLAVGKKMDIKQVKKDMLKRDQTDYKRKEGPLKKAKDAFAIDTSQLTIEQTIDKMLALMYLKSFKHNNLSYKAKK